MKVYLIRHGQTDLNAKRIHDGNTSSLSEKGREQAKLVAKRLAQFNTDLLIASPFDRTKQTAEIISKEINQPIAYSELFVEIKRATEIEGKNYDDPLSIAVKNQIFINYKKPDWHYSDEENFFDFKNRGLKGLKFLEELNAEGVVLVTHHDIMKILISLMLFGPDLHAEDYLRIRLFIDGHNTGITVCEFKNNTWKLITWNDHSHLD